MKSRVYLTMLPVLLAMVVLASSKSAQAVDVGVGVNIGGGHHYRDGGVVEYRTTDPAYSTWYPDTNSSYVYTAPDAGIYVDPAPAYVYSTDSVEFGGWYGGGRSGHGGYYGGGRGGFGGGGRGGGGGGHRR